MRVKKRPFILLEIMIAIALVALFTLPLTLNPTRLLIQEVKMLERMEAERIADLSFLEVKEKLLRQQIPWSELKEGKKKKYPLENQHFISLAGFKKKRVNGTFSLRVKNEKEGDGGTIYRHLIVTIELSLPAVSEKEKLPAFNYHLFAQKVKEVSE